MLVNTTRLMLNNTCDWFIPISENRIKLKNNQNNTFFLFFGLPNSPITSIVDDGDEMLSSTSESEIESTSDTPNIYDINDNTSEETKYETFFTQLSHKFSVFDSLIFEEIRSELFLDTCEEYFSLVDKFNSPIFSPLKADVNDNINRLRRRMNEDVMKYQTLYDIINDEIKTGTTNGRNSATNALLWLKRVFELLTCLVNEFGIGDKTLSDAITKAYDQSLKQYHGLFARGIFSIALRAVPNNTEFFRSLAIDPTDASKTSFEHQILKEMREHGASISSVFEKISLFYFKHGLESAAIIA